MELVTARPHGLEGEWLRRIADCVQSGGRAVILVPPQETLNTELRLMDGLGLNGSFVLDVLSPGRLRERVFERAGKPDRIVFDQKGKQMLLSEILEEEKENLRIYSRAASFGQESLAAKLGELIACWKRAGLQPSDMRLRAEEAEGALALKLADAALIYARYEERLCGRLADAEDILEEERARLQASRVLEGRDVFISGFDIITPGFASEMAEYEHAAHSLTLFVETDGNSVPDGRLFAPVNASLARMKKQMGEQGIAIRKTVCTERPERAPELRALASSLFALSAKPETGIPQHIELTAASTCEREVQLAFARIRKEMAAGLKPSETAVVYPKDSGYASLMQAVPALYGITAYTAEKRQAAAHPLCRFLLSALRATEEKDIRTADALECLKTGFLNVPFDAADALASYCEQMEIRNGGLQRPFRYKLSASMTDEELASVEETREKTAECLLSFRSEMKEASSPDGVIRALLSLLDGVNAGEKLQEMRQTLTDAGLESEAEDCAQVWNALMGTLDQLHDLLPEHAPAELVRRMLEEGLSALELSALPPAEGAVVCGEIGNLRARDLKLLFVLGMNDREGGKTAGLFTPAEQKSIEDGGVFLGLSDPEREALSSLDVLKVMTGAKHLVISYALADENGAALREGEAVQALRRLFPDLTVRGGLAEEELPQLLCAPKPAARALALSLRSGNGTPSKAFFSAAAELEAHEPDAVQMLSSELETRLTRRLDPEQALDLYGRGRQTTSVSRLETFAACPYRYFISYGISPEEPRETGIDRTELGTLYHETAERFLNAAMRDPDFPDLSPEKIEQMTGEASADLLTEIRKSPYGESKRGDAAAQRIRRTAVRVTSTVLHQYQEGKFKPLQTELAFGEGNLPPLQIELANGEILFLKGKIDRVDVLPEDGMLRVIDYKSSLKEVDPTEIYYGLQLQLCLYLLAALRIYPNCRAAGFFYFHLRDPLIATDSRIQEEVEREIAKRLSLSGVCLADVKVLRAMDPERAAQIKKDGTVSARAKDILPAEELDGLLAFARQKAAGLAEDLASGVIDDDPYELPNGSQNACRYCGYHAVCGFDPARKSRRRLEKKTFSDLVVQK